MILNIMYMTSSNQMVPVLVGNRLGPPLQLRLARAERFSVAIRCRSSIAWSSTPGKIEAGVYLKLKVGYDAKISWNCPEDHIRYAGCVPNFAPESAIHWSSRNSCNKLWGTNQMLKAHNLFDSYNVIICEYSSNMKLSWITNPFKLQHMRCPRTTDSHQLGVVEGVGKPIFPDRMECKSPWTFWLWYGHEIGQ